MPTQMNWGQLCQGVLSGTASSVYGPVANGTQVSISAATAWNPASAAGSVTVDLFITPPSGSAADATHVDRVSVPPGVALPLSNAINHKLTTGQSIYAVGNGVTLTISGSIAS